MCVLSNETNQGEEEGEWGVMWVFIENGLGLWRIEKAEGFVLHVNCAPSLSSIGKGTNLFL